MSEARTQQRRISYLCVLEYSMRHQLRLPHRWPGCNLYVRQGVSYEYTIYSTKEAVFLFSSKS